MRSSIYSLVVGSWISLHVIEIFTANVSPVGTQIQTDTLPSLHNSDVPDWRRMPYIGNGHLATVVYNGTLYLNGLYNGRGANIHRARIPNEIGFRLEFPHISASSILRRFTLNMEEGYWEENITIANAVISHRVYAHQKYTQILVAQVHIETRSSYSEIVKLTRHTDYSSPDISFNDKVASKGATWQRQGETKEPTAYRHNSREYNSRSRLEKVHLFWTSTPEDLHILPKDKSKTVTFLLSIDSKRTKALQAFETAYALAYDNPAQFFEDHAGAWRTRWERGRIEIVGRRDLEELAYSSLYYLLSSLPSSASERELGEFYGVSPSGLAHGGSGKDGYRGQVRSDMDLWVLPAVLLLHPEQARVMLKYRVHHGFGARDSDEVLEGDRGRNPHSPMNMGNPKGCCSAGAAKKEDPATIAAVVAFAARLYVSCTLNVDWLEREGGFQLIKESAKYWLGRAIRNERTGRFDIKGVTSPDPSRRSVTNSVFTNAAASLAIYFARYSACLSAKDVTAEVPDSWIDIAENLHLPYNTSLQYHVPYEGFDKLSGAAQSGNNVDTILLGFPLMWPMSQELRQRNLDAYSHMNIRESADNQPPWPAAVLAIGYLEVGGSRCRADDYFNRTYAPFVTEPFKVWSELPGGEGASSYITGGAAYLQVLQYGYAGIRVKVDRLELSPQLPAGVTRLSLIDLDYLTSRLTVRVTEARVDVGLTQAGEWALRLRVNGTGAVYALTQAVPYVSFPRGPFSIYAAERPGCKLPRDAVNNEYISVAVKSSVTSQYKASAVSLTISLLIVVFSIREFLLMLL